MAIKARRWWYWPRHVLLVVAIPVAFVILLFSLPIILPFLALQTAREDKRKNALVVAWPCGWCVAPLGAQALARADALFRAYCDKIIGDGTSHVRFVRDLRACCLRCNAGHNHDEKSNRFVLLHAETFAATFGDLLDTAVEPASATMAWPWLPPRRAGHGVKLTRDSVCLADDAEAPHDGTLDMPPDVDVAAIAEALLRSPWLAHVGGDASWWCTAGSVVLVFGLRARLPFVHRQPGESVRADTVEALHVRYEAQRDPDELCSAVLDGRAPQ